jgi:ERCC4-related helicase
MDIKRRSQSSYMLVVSSGTDASVENDVSEFLDNHNLIKITKNMGSDDVRDYVQNNIRNYNNPAVVIEEYDDMDDDLQKFLSQYLKGVAEKHVKLPIIVYDDEGGNLGFQNPDLHGRVYSL